ncbi:hypothetical protein KAR91_47335, partial [Candidatus Pacearchaeota archaeon]|nr:hypothetical protein [Candidatus Pacearchaeota archaeon]
IRIQQMKNDVIVNTLQLTPEQIKEKSNDKGYVIIKPDDNIHDPKGVNAFYKNLDSGVKSFVLRPSRIFDTMDGYANFQGEVHDLAYNSVNETINNELISQDKRKADINKAFKETKMVPKDLSRVFDFTHGEKTEKISTDEGLSIYFGWRNEYNREALQGAYSITQKNIDTLKTQLTDEELFIGEQILGDYEDNYDRIRDAKITYDNEDLGHQENYIPIIRIDTKTEKKILAAEIGEAYGARKAFPAKGFTKERIKQSRQNQGKIQLGMYSQWLEQIDKQEHFIHSAELARDLQNVFGDPNVIESIDHKLGKSFNKAVENYLNNYANPNLQDGYNAVTALAKATRQNLAASALAFNAVTVMKQLPSLIYYLGEAGPGRLIQSLGQFIHDPLGMIKFVEDRDPQIKHRSIEREIDEFHRAGKNKFQKIRNKIANVGMAPISVMDKIAVTIGWNAVFLNKIEGPAIMSEAEAIREAQNATLRTQPAGARKDAARLYTTSEVLNVFTQFTNQLNQILNMTTHDVKSKWKAGDKKAASLTVLGLTMGAVAIWTMSNLRPPRDEDDWKDVVMSQAAMVPILGNMFVNVNKGFTGGHVPAFTAIEKLFQAAKPDAKEETRVKNFLQGFAVLSGIPYTQPRRVVKAIQEEDFLELFGGVKE